MLYSRCELNVLYFDALGLSMWFEFASGFTEPKLAQDAPKREVGSCSWEEPSVTSAGSLSCDFAEQVAAPETGPVRRGNEA